MPQLAVEFFSKIARLEFALKALDRYRRLRGGTVEADWDSFAQQPHIEALFQDLRADPVARYLIESPPKKRIVRAGAFAWSEQPNACETMSDVCRMLRRTRNNLFHGDKDAAGSEHDDRLLLAGLVVMDALIEADLAVQGTYVPNG